LVVADIVRSARVGRRGAGGTAVRARRSSGAWSRWATTWHADRAVGHRERGEDRYGGAGARARSDTLSAFRARDAARACSC